MSCLVGALLELCGNATTHVFQDHRRIRQRRCQFLTTVRLYERRLLNLSYGLFRERALEGRVF
jgi:hypothetical protein